VNHTDLLVLGEHSLEAIEYVLSKGKQWMLYNGGSRFKRGFYMFRVLRLGCQGR
jgi:hypothetical protein